MLPPPSRCEHGHPWRCHVAAARGQSGRGREKKATPKRTNKSQSRPDNEAPALHPEAHPQPGGSARWPGQPQLDGPGPHRATGRAAARVVPRGGPAYRRRRERGCRQHGAGDPHRRGLRYGRRGYRVGPARDCRRAGLKGRRETCLRGDGRIGPHTLQQRAEKGGFGSGRLPVAPRGRIRARATNGWRAFDGSACLPIAPLRSSR